MKIANNYYSNQSQQDGTDSILNQKQQENDTNKINQLEINAQNTQHRKQSSVCSLQNGQITQFYFDKLLHIEVQLCLIIVLNLFLVVTSSSINFPTLQQSQSLTYKGCLFFSLICFIIECLLLGFRMMTVLELQKQQKILYQKSTIFSSKKIFYYFAECLIMFIQPSPFYEDIYIKTQDTYFRFDFQLPLNDLLTAFSVLKVFVLIRAGLILTPYRSIRSNRLCKMYGCKADFSFSLKCMFKDNPLVLIGIFFTVSAMIFAFQINLVQRRAAFLAQNKSGFTNNYMNALWLVLMTITTVGYGDYFPHTAIGRILILIVAIWGTFIVSMMVVVISNTLTMEKNQKRTSIVLNKLLVRAEIQQQAKKLIIYFILFKKYQKNYRMINSSNNYQKIKINLSKKTIYQNMKKYHYKSIKSQKAFSRLRKQIKNGQDIQDIQDEVASHFLHVNSDIQILNRNQQKIISFIHEHLEYNGQINFQKENQKKQENSSS